MHCISHLKVLKENFVHRYHVNDRRQSKRKYVIEKIVVKCNDLKSKPLKFIYICL